ncbi:YkvA family protein [Aneurinibacillus aneurinilyticus]|uniref:YkvA family protein n=1 Tax=Aneurinibacillus aneurinilyticus TaxID=1391 RepID=UPI003523BC93
MTEQAEENFKVENEEEYVKKGFWAKVKETTAKVPFVLDAVSMYYCSIDQKTPLVAKGIALAALSYFILPIDAIPDVIPIAGFTDDAAW